MARNPCAATVLFDFALARPIEHMYDYGVFEALAGEVDGLAVPGDADGLAELLAISDRLTAKLVEGLRAFDAAGGWDTVGATSLTSWLVDKGASRQIGRAHV